MRMEKESGLDFGVESEIGQEYEYILKRGYLERGHFSVEHIEKGDEERLVTEVRMKRRVERGLH